MKQKKDDFYFKNLMNSVECSRQAADFLKQTVSHYDAASLKKSLEAMHELEQTGDAKKHKMTKALSKAFITPLEREDLAALSSHLDDITDAVEDVLMRFYMYNIREVREDVYPLLDLLPQCVDALSDVLKELKNYKHSETIEQFIIRVNDLEEQGDALYMECMHRLHQETDVRTIMIWRNIYEGLEKCLDTCEHAADVVSAVIMKNS